MRAAISPEQRRPANRVDGISWAGGRGGECGSQCNFAERRSVSGHCKRCDGRQGGTERQKENGKKVQYVINKQINTKQNNWKGKVVAQRYWMSRYQVQSGETKGTF